MSNLAQNFLGSFVWDQVETELRYDESDPLEQLIEKENMKQLSKSLFSLSHDELVSVMMLNYDEGSYDTSDVRDYFRVHHGKKCSLYKVKKYEESGLRNLRRHLRFNCGWER